MSALAFLVPVVLLAQVSSSPSAGRGSGLEAAAPQETLVSFDPRLVEVRWNQQHWHLQAGGVWLKDFGQRDTEAREAARLIRALNLTQRGTVGKPVPIMEYWLSSGHAPRGHAGAQRLKAIDLGSLRAQEIQGRWCVRDDRQVFFNFGTQRDEAERAVAIIRHYGFSRIGYLGAPVPSMIYFLAEGPGPRDLFAPSPTNSLQKGRPGDSGQTENAQQMPAGNAGKTLHLSAEQKEQLRLAATVVPQLAPPPMGTMMVLRFEPQSLMLRQEGSDWKIYSANQPLANFGPDRQSAQRTLAVLQHYRCTEQCLLGQPVAFSYFLSNGVAPRGMMPGLHGYTFRPEQILAKPFGPTWMLTEGERPLLTLGNDAALATSVVQAIRRHQFDTLIWLGQGEKRLPLLVRVR